MRRIILLILVCVASFNGVNAQKWSELNDEQKMMKLKSFREDNQKYLKNTLGMTQTQLNDIDNVNICFLSTLDRIDRYVKTDADKQKYAEAVSNARWAQLDAIMGVDKHNKYAEYLKAKLEKMEAAHK
jgi:hypothetical protein